MTAPLRAMPDFLIIGTMKGGTSSLFRYLQQHPMVKAPIRKELHYFSMGWHKGLNWYRAHFPTRVRLRGGAVTGEATPGYMFTPDVENRIHAVLPDVRLIAVLRDPAERAVSHYFHELRMGREYLPIEQAMQVEDERLATADPESAEGLETYLHASYKKRGIYADQLERYLRLFPRERILVLGSGTLYKTPRVAVEKALAFLGLETADQDYSFDVRNRGVSRKRVPDRVYDDLRAYFEPHNERLFDLLGRPLDW